MIFWLLIFFLAYVALLSWNAYQAHRKNRGQRSEYLYAGSGIMVVPLFVSYAATLFSTFTLMGVPDFFRAHGVGTWIFIGVTDVAMAFVVLWFGLRYRRIVAFEGIRTINELLRVRYKSALPSRVYLVGIFLFLAPYVAIQIQGVSSLIGNLTPTGVPAWFWSAAMLMLIITYSYVGGLRAIVYSDVVQGLVLLGVIWIVGMVALDLLGGPTQMFENVRTKNPELLTAPGPNGLMTMQYLLSSFLVICLMPITQPQLTIRIGIARSDRDLRIMAIGIGFFAFLILLPTIAIGFYGAVLYSNDPTSSFLAHALVTDQVAIVGALAVIGLIASAMSTADSQLFALSAEAHGMHKAGADNNTTQTLRRFRISIIIFVLGSFVLSLVSSQELASLARVSFAGTALMAPMIIGAILRDGPRSITSPALSALAMVAFTLSLFGYIPPSFNGVRLDLGLLAFLFIWFVGEVALNKMRISAKAP